MSCKLIIPTGDVEVNVMQTWTGTATKCLISTYVQFEKEMEDPKAKKKEVWAKVMTSMLKQGHIYSRDK
jgi:hypothetical protein